MHAVRRKPVQQRSVATVGYLLDAAAHILEEGGMAAYNTNAVAARAGISIGSLYQYFPDKDAITAALVLRAHEAIAATLADAIEATDGMSVDEAIDVLLDLMIAQQSRNPRLGRLLEVEEDRLPRGPDLIAIEAEIDRLNRVFFGRFADPHLGSAALDLAARDIGRIVRALLDAELADETGGLDAANLRDRLARAIGGYFAPLLAA